MAQVETERFTCEACEKTYRWNSDLAGKRVKCKCGHVMTAPLAPPEDDLYAMAPAPEKPRPLHQPPPVAAVATASLRGPASTAPVVGYAGAVRNSQPAKLDEVIGGPPWKEIYLPAALVLIGMFLQIGMISNWHFSMVQSFLPLLSVRLGINLVLSFMGIVVVVKMMEINIGSPGPMVLKLTAIALAVPAISGIIGQLIGHDSLFVAATISTMLQGPIGITLFWLLFDMEVIEALYCVVVIWLVNQWAVIFLAGMILHV